MLKGFKDFIMRGNLVEIAVAFVIGGAFATVVTSFTAVLLALIAKATGGSNPDRSRFRPGGIPLGILQARMASGEEEAPPSPDTVLLTEIRDLLAGRPGSPNVRGPGGLS